MSRQILRLGATLRKDIGRHAPMIGLLESNDVYQAARQKSDDAVSLAKYLIQHLDNRHHAVLLARAAGMPGYINLR